jgi:ATP-dependent 26S proteasome regulatory subunit
MFKDKLGRYLDSGFPIIYVESNEYIKCRSLIEEAAGDFRSLMEWSPGDGLYDHKEGIREAISFEDLLQRMSIDPLAFENRVLLLQDVTSYLESPVVVSLIKEVARRIRDGFSFDIVIIEKEYHVPSELEDFVTLLEMDPLDETAVQEIIENFLKEQGQPLPEKRLLKRISRMMKGLTEMEIQDLLALALSDDGEITSSDIALVFEQKRQTIKKSGILEMIPVHETIEDIGGLEAIKEWLQDNAVVFSKVEEARDFGVDIPKGVLVVGMPGCGKSITAKAVAALFQIPLLRMDMGKLMGKYVGESEKNMRKAIRLAEEVSPCVLWIDEMEKAFAGIGESGGGAEVTTRLFGTFLTWLQEKQSLAFVVATANNIAKLPPELLRKGRFDEIFYVDLPTLKERKEIFQIHLNKRRPKDAFSIDIDKLAQQTNGYTGADIEGVVKDGIKKAFVQGRSKVTTEDFSAAIGDTYSLSEIMPDVIQKMREAYKKCKFKNASR